MHDNLSTVASKTDRQPAFLQDSRLRPLLSIAGQRGLQSLPSDISQFVDRLKTARGA